MSKEIYVKLKDTTSIFTDIRSGASVTGDSVVKMPLTEQVREGIRGGAIVETEKPKESKSKGTDKKEKKPVGIETELLETPEAVEYLKKTNDDLKSELDERNIEYDDDDVKKELVRKLLAADENDDAKIPNI